MNFNKELCDLVNRELKAGATPFAVIGAMEVTKAELAGLYLAATQAQQSAILAAKIIPPINPNGR